MVSKKYRRWYRAIIKKAKGREPLTGYCERHHVLPKSMGGSNEKSNIVVLTFREHFICHWLLAKFTTGQDRRKMQSALHRMTFSRSKKVILSSWQYEVARKAARDAMLGYKHSEEVRARFSITLTGRKLSDEHLAKLSGENAPMYGRKHTAEARAKMSAALRGRVGTMLGRKGEQSPLYGRKYSAATRVKMSVAATGQKHTAATKLKLSAAATTRWASPEARAKNSASCKLGWARRKAHGEIVI